MQKFTCKTLAIDYSINQLYVYNSFTYFILFIFTINEEHTVNSQPPLCLCLHSFALDKMQNKSLCMQVVCLCVGWGHIPPVCLYIITKLRAFGFPSPQRC